MCDCGSVTGDMASNMVEVSSTVSEINRHTLDDGIRAEHLAAQYAMISAINAGHTDSSSVEEHFDTLIEKGANFDLERARVIATEDIRSLIDVELFISASSLVELSGKSRNEYLKELAKKIKKQCGVSAAFAWTHEEAEHACRISTAWDNKTLEDQELVEEVDHIRLEVFDKGDWHYNS